MDAIAGFELSDTGVQHGRPIRKLLQASSGACLLGFHHLPARKAIQEVWPARALAVRVVPAGWVAYVDQRLRRAARFSTMVGLRVANRHAACGSDGCSGMRWETGWQRLCGRHARGVRKGVLCMAAGMLLGLCSILFVM
eukprot:363927-Chlamydomonas_euryale.AAC.9